MRFESLMTDFMLQPDAIDGSNSPLPGTGLLTSQGDLGLQMVEGIRRFLLQETKRQVDDRARLWRRDYSSAVAYERSIAENRQRFRRIIGAVDERVATQAPGLVKEISERTEIAASADYRVYAIRWPVFAPATADSNGLAAEGLCLEPNAALRARVVAIPDADCPPELIAGLATGIPREAQFARRMAENGVQVVVPLIINRNDTYSGIPGVGMTNMPHREWIYRMAFEAGRHIIGFEVQKVLAALDWLESGNPDLPVPMGVMGYGEGGLLALYSAAIDTRIKATVVSGYFQPREGIWQEPIYRDVWGLLREFGDAELAGMIAPRTLIVESCKGPEVTGPPQPEAEHAALACPNGRLTSSPLEAIEKEIDRARPFFRNLAAESRLRLIRSANNGGHPGSEAAIHAFLSELDGNTPALKPPSESAKVISRYDSEVKLKEQFDQLVAFTQALIRRSPEIRRDFWKHADSRTIPNWQNSTAFYRDYIWREVIGRLPSPTLPLDPRTRRILDAPRFTGYEVMMDVWPNVYAYGILLLPKDLKPPERRPVVVCQHGLEGRPSDVADPAIDNHFYHHFAADLAEEGFITYAPQNPYLGEDHFRILQRIGHPIKVSLFSVILGQHEQTLKWLSAQPFVDPKRIGFYGLSYGGKTAVRVPPLLDGYALSICSGDFNEWVWKTTTVLAQQSYLLTKEYDMYEFDFANTVNYAELAELMAPRPFMVERGHDDPVGLDQWVAFEYAKVREFYDKMGIGNQTEIEFFNGPHEVHGEATLRFLRRHLHWPE